MSTTALALAASITLNLGGHAVATMDLDPIEMRTQLDTSHADQVSIVLQNGALAAAFAEALRKATERAQAVTEDQE